MRATIKDLCSIQIGLQFRGRIEPNPDGTHAVILIRNISPDRQLRDEKEQDGALDRVIPPVPAERYLIHKDDILFLSRGNNNYAIPILREFPMPTIAPGFFFILRIGRSVDSTNILPEYLAWAINRPDAQDFFRQKARRGTHMPVVGKAELQELKVPVPSLSVQRDVVELTRLHRREQDIMRQISERREVLFRAVCEHAINR